MAVTDEDVRQARQDAMNEKNQRRMEKGIYGEPLPLPKPGKAVEPQTLPGKPEKKKSLGEGATKYAKGGTASARADGCAQRGKTRGKIV
jgi:hypothetical protein